MCYSLWKRTVKIKFIRLQTENYNILAEIKSLFEGNNDTTSYSKNKKTKFKNVNFIYFFILNGLKLNF